MVTDDGPAREYARNQIIRADHGAADNQCPGCGTYRTDGQPPTLHREQCPVALRAASLPEGGPPQ